MSRVATGVKMFRSVRNASDNDKIGKHVLRGPASGQRAILLVDTYMYYVIQRGRGRGQRNGKRGVAHPRSRCTNEREGRNDSSRSRAASLDVTTPGKHTQHARRRLKLDFASGPGGSDRQDRPALGPSRRARFARLVGHPPARPICCCCCCFGSLTRPGGYFWCLLRTGEGGPTAELAPPARADGFVLFPNAMLLNTREIGEVLSYYLHNSL